MNKVYAVTYDLKTPGRSYAALYSALKKSPKWWHYLESTWLIASQETADQLYKRLASLIASSDRLLVIEVRNNTQGWVPKEAWNWINENVPK